MLYEKQCTVCGYIWESEAPILDDPFICPRCVKAIWQYRKASANKAQRVLNANKKEKVKRDGIVQND
ncbi:MAG: hypothetical protein RSC97_09695 [Eubacterium sp.]